MEARQNYLFLEQAKGYVKVLEKSTSPFSTMREVFEHCAQSDLRGGKRLKVVLKVPSFYVLPTKFLGKLLKIGNHPFCNECSPLRVTTSQGTSSHTLS